jgi:hypothetical protein
MSAGAFATGAKYEADDGKIYNVRVQPETLEANVGGANGSPTGAVTSGLPSAQVGSGRKTIGVHCRGVRLRFTESVPDGYKPNSIVFIPILVKSRWDAVSRGSAGVYLGLEVTVVGKVPEVIR